MADVPGFDYENILRACPVVLGMTEDSPAAVFSRLFDALVAAGRLPADLRETARAAVNAREQAGGSTALANGIAIPHGYMDELENPVVAIGVHVSGVDCSSIGQPSRIFILLLNKRDSRDHIRFLAAVNRRLIIPEVRAGILVAQSRDEVLRLLAS